MARYLIPAGLVILDETAGPGVDRWSDFEVWVLSQGSQKQLEFRGLIRSHPTVYLDEAVLNEFGLEAGLTIFIRHRLKAPV